jgi:hypothetical protein
MRQVTKKEIVENVDEHLESNSTTSGVSISAGASIEDVSLSASANWENTNQIVDTIRTATTSETDVTISESVKVERTCELTSL